jgi:hypothetical protein
LVEAANGLHLWEPRDTFTFFQQRFSETHRILKYCKHISQRNTFLYLCFNSRMLIFSYDVPIHFKPRNVILCSLSHVNHGLYEIITSILTCEVFQTNTIWSILSILKFRQLNSFFWFCESKHLIIFRGSYSSLFHFF